MFYEEREKKRHNQQKWSPNNTNSNNNNNNSNKYNQTTAVSSITPQQSLSNVTRNSRTSQLHRTNKIALSTTEGAKM
ncbi:unnamed protein product [Rotaria sp. Silwood2]|nr:unnamed protein product [Rotaria sp. Silwood2]CAF4758967.1 unnamed protein product [Rotaria sp. Silwood2]CAF4936781.1 unnamed protein product [Rotaria sp. Silwood2]